MTDREYVIRAAKTKGYAVHLPTRAAPEILVMHWVNGKGAIVTDAPNWKEARAAINAYMLSLA